MIHTDDTDIMLNICTKFKHSREQKRQKDAERCQRAEASPRNHEKNASDASFLRGVKTVSQASLMSLGGNDDMYTKSEKKLKCTI